MNIQSQAALEFSCAILAKQVTCGPDTIGGLGSILDQFGCQRAMVVCGPGVCRAPDVVKRVQRALGGRWVGMFSGVMPHSPAHVVSEAVAVARDLCPDCLVSVGGGSTHDTSKGIAILLAEGGDIQDYQVRFEPPDKVTVPKLLSKKIPVVAVPTTMGAAEFTGGGGGITDEALNRKFVVSDPGVAPRAIIIDGQALATTPIRIQLSTAMGQLRMAVEGFGSTRHNPISDALCLGAIKMLVRYLSRFREQDLSSLLSIKTAAAMPSLEWVLGWGLNTAIAHHVGSAFGVPHGEANAVLLPHTMRFNADASTERQVMIAEAMGIPTGHLNPREAGLAAAESVARLSRDLGLPTRLRDMGVPLDGLEAIAVATLSDRQLLTNPKPILGAAPVMEVLRAAW